jgi:hypothetical protein
VRADAAQSRGFQLELLADLYLQADHYTPALETIERLLERPEARALSADRRAGLESKCISASCSAGSAGAGTRARIMLPRGVHRLDAASEPPPPPVGRGAVRARRLEEAAVAARRGLDLADETGDLSLSAWALGRRQTRLP